MTGANRPQDSLSLAPGSAAILRSGDGPDASDWHLQATEQSCWLTSPALPTPTGSDETRRDQWWALMTLQAMATEPQGLRVLIDEEGDLVLQCPVGQDSGRTGENLSSSLTAPWSALQKTWAVWNRAFTGRLSMQEALDASTVRPTADAHSRPLLDQLAALAATDSELAQLHLERDEDGSLILESPEEAWVVGLQRVAVAGRVRITTPVAFLPQDLPSQLVVVEKALRLNSGISLGPHWFIAVDDDASEDALLMLQGVLEVGQMQADDLKAAIGKALTMGAELEANCSGLLAPSVQPAMVDIMTWRA